MTVPTEPEVAGRLQRALLSFQKAQALLLTAHRRLKDLPAAQVEQFWAVQGNRIEKHVQTAAVEVIAAFQVYSAAGMVAGAGDQHLIAEAQHLVAGGAP